VEERIPDALSVERLIERRVHAAGVGGRLAGPRVKSAFQAWDLGAFRGIRARSLSATQLRRVVLAAQWACPALAWFLDNPTDGLEPEWREATPNLLHAWLKREGGAIVTATHDADLAAHATRVAILARGRVAALDAPEALCKACAPEEVVMRTMDSDRAAKALDEVLHLEAERLPEGLRVRVRRAEQALPGIIQAAGSSIETVWVRRATLHDAVARYSQAAKPPGAPDRPPRD
jgi:ABC-type multidrug transport system ATPase subunit